jgi:signal transduction histidine kinase/ligand-binding sensor domain-containing protein
MGNSFIGLQVGSIDTLLTFMTTASAAAQQIDGNSVLHRGRSLRTQSVAKRPRSLQLRRRYVKFALVILFALTVAKAQRPAEGHLLFRSWAPGSDARQRSVLAILQSRDGYIWIGTGHGLMRFDGVSFTRFTSGITKGMEGDRISFGTLWEDTSGAIWAGTDFQGVVRDDHGRFQTLQTEQGLPDLRVLRIDGDETGAVWIYTLTGVSRWRNGKLERMHPEQDKYVAGTAISFSYKRTIDFAKTGLWRHSPSGLERFSYGHWAKFLTPPGASQPFEDDVKSIYEDQLHRVWYSVLSQPGKYYCFDQGSLRVFAGLPPDAEVSFQDRSGFLWLTDPAAHTALWKDGKLYPLPGLRAPFFIHALEERDGSVWAGTAGTDLYQFRQRHIGLIPTAGAPEFGPMLFQQRNGQAWAGSSDVDRISFSGNLPSAVAVTAVGRPAPWIQIKALSEDKDGNLLIASRGVAGVEQLHGSVYRPYLAPNRFEGNIQTMLLSVAGEQWIGTSAGLYVIRDRAQNPIRLLSSSVRSLFEFEPGSVWVGTNDGPYLFVNGSRQPVVSVQRWRFGPVIALKQFRSGEVWMATQEHGAVLYAGHDFHPLGSAEGLPTDNIYGLEFGQDGDLWLESDVGLMRVRRKSVERVLAHPDSKIQVSLFDDADGIPASTLDPLGNQGSLRLENWKLWFATENGIAQLDPTAMPAANHSTHAVIEEHTIDGSDLLTGPIVLHAGQSNLEVHYTALGSERPEQLIFRYRLQGYDTDWVYAHGRRVAYYSHLPPDDYTLEVESADNDGAGWDAKGATASVQVLTPFYRTMWMKALACVVLLSIVGFIVERRRRNILREQRVRQAFTHRLITTQEGERKRIAHELHDSLGQHLVVIRTLAMLPPASAGTVRSDQMVAIADQAAVAIKEVESISYDLRPYQLDRLGLTKAILSLLETFTTSSAAKIDCALDHIDGYLPKELDINLYRIVQEALGNILKHSGATQVSISVTRTSKMLRMKIADNGRGFTTGSADTAGAGLGLIGIYERAEALGGHATIESSEGGGTAVTVEVVKTRKS